MATEEVYEVAVPDDLRQAVNDRDWEAADKIFDQLPVPEKIAMARAIVGDDDRSGGVPIVAAAGGQPLTPEQVTLRRAERLVEIGWDVRTARLAREVGPEQFRVLHDYLRRAERLLIEITATDPTCVAAWDLRLTTAMGLRLGLAEARRRYSQVAAVDPHNFAAQRKLLQQLCPKWGGTWEAAFAFARECVAAAPPGSPNAEVLITAYLERAMDSDETKDHAPAWRGPDALRELTDAADRSVWHAHWRGSTAEASQIHGDLAMIFVLLDRPDLARRHFEVLDDDPPANGIWSRLDDPDGQVYREERNRALNPSRSGRSIAQRRMRLAVGLILVVLGLTALGSLTVAVVHTWSGGHLDRTWIGVAVGSAVLGAFFKQSLTRNG
jgi:hypothetical protein